MMTKLKLHSPDFTQANIAKLAELFPNCVTEIKDEGGRMKDEKVGENSSFIPEPSSLKYAIDFDQLRQELSPSVVEGPQERYQLNWPGKREALLTANAPIAKTLRPCREENSSGLTARKTCLSKAIILTRSSCCRKPIWAR